jgi:hypothetical protein
MDEDRRGRGQGRLGSWLGDYEDLVQHEGGEGDDGEPLRVRKLWNPVTYRCAYCGASFMSRAMIRHHLEQHHEHDEDASEDEQVDLAA